MGVVTGEMRELFDRWIDEGQRLIGVLLAFLEEADRLQNQADMAERECERLREEVGQLRAEREGYRREREEIADSLARVMGDMLLRLHPRTEAQPEIPEPMAERTSARSHPMPLN
ncbi:MAG: hypothetical protein ACE5JN_02595 [Candidatus Methylomirabilia bacterium]